MKRVQRTVARHGQLDDLAGARWSATTTATATSDGLHRSATSIPSTTRWANSRRGSALLIWWRTTVSVLE
jgi:hypothetical protein